MALKINMERKAFGKQVLINDVYVRVNQVEGTKNNVNFNASYMDENAVETFETSLFSFVPDMNGGNFIAQAYKHLKTLPEFKGAQDC